MGCESSRPAGCRVKCPFLVALGMQIIEAFNWLQAQNARAPVLYAVLRCSAGVALKRGGHSQLAEFSLKHVMTVSAAKTSMRVAETGPLLSWNYVAIMLNEELTAIEPADRSFPEPIAALQRSVAGMTQKLDKDLSSVLFCTDSPARGPPGSVETTL